MYIMKRTYIFPRVVRLLVSHAVITILFLTGLLFFIHTEHFGDMIVRIMIAEHILTLTLFYYRIFKPVKEMNRAFVAFSEGYTMQDIFNQRFEINAEHDAMIQRVNQILDKTEMFKMSKRQAEYLALQNQINPHFLYNTLEGIRSEALIGGMDSVAEMAEALAKFFRYTISNLKTMVTVEDELNNVRNYCLIQQYRFGNKIQLKIEYDDGDEEIIRNSKMPKLILQPIVENSIRHGIEPLIGQGSIVIRLQIVSGKLHIFISDNGIGMANDALLELNQKLKKTFPAVEESEQSGGIAMVNVNNRIKLLFGDEYGLHFYSTPQLGTDVEILLPVNESKAG